MGRTSSRLRLQPGRLFWNVRTWKGCSTSTRHIYYLVFVYSSTSSTKECNGRYHHRYTRCSGTYSSQGGFVLCRCMYYVLERARSTMLTEASSSLLIRQYLCSFASSLDLYEYENIVCSYPPEYCEFGSHLTRCKEWLESTHPDLFVKYWSDGESWFSFTSAPSYPHLSSKHSWSHIFDFVPHVLPLL
jgi:hypothetical protein